MWRSIYVGSGVNLTLEGAVIEDAVDGIFRSGAGNQNIKVSNTTFRNCYIGIFSQSNALQSVENSTFEGGILKPHPNQADVDGNLSYQGIHLSGNTPTTVNNCTFNNLLEGIEGVYQTNLVVTNSHFKDIRQKTCLTHEGYGIYINGNGKGSLVVTGSDFTNGNVAIKTFRSATVTCNSNKIESPIAASRGIDIEQGAGSTELNDNTISVTTSGVASVDCDDALSPKQTIGIKIINRACSLGNLSGNIIVINGGTSTQGRAIDIQNVAGELAMQKNSIKMNTSGAGISVANCTIHAIAAVHNNITMTQKNTQGIAVKGSTTVPSKDNTIVGNNAANQKGIYYYTTPRSFICNNTVEKTNVGIEFSGPCETEDGIKVNTFKSCKLGLRLTQFATSVGTQTRMGNKWTLGTNTVAARHEGSNSSSSTFYYNTDTDIEHKPNPSYSPSTLFIYQEGKTITECEVHKPVVSENDIQIIKENYQDGETTYKEEAQWLGESYLYQKLKSEPKLQNETGMSGFVEKKEGTNIGIFYAIEQLIVKSYGATEEKEKNAFLYEAMKNNFSIEPKNLIEENQRGINEIFLYHLLNDGDKFSSDQLDLLESVAAQCPIRGGNAVFLARGLHQQNKIYDDEVLCNTVPIFGRVQHNSISSFSLSPNPAQEQVELNYTLSAEDKQVPTFWVVSDIRGKEVMRQEVNAANSKHLLNISNLGSNLYLCKLQTATDRVLVTKKLNIIH